jgi:hypothetical protein
VKLRPWTLPAAAWLAAIETAALIAALAVSGKSAAPILIAFLAVKLPFCVLVTQRRPGAYLGLIVWEAAGAIAAVGAHSMLLLRLLEIAAAATVIGLLVASTPMFPSVGLPDSST